MEPVSAGAKATATTVGRGHSLQLCELVGAHSKNLEAGLAQRVPCQVVQGVRKFTKADEVRGIDWTTLDWTWSTQREPGQAAGSGQSCKEGWDPGGEGMVSETGAQEKAKLGDTEMTLETGTLYSNPASDLFSFLLITPPPPLYPSPHTISSASLPTQGVHIR